MRTIAVTGGSGKLGTHVVELLKKEGYKIRSLDAKRADRLGGEQLAVDLSDFGQVAGALGGVDAIVHLAAIPAPLGHTNSYIFSNNVLSTYNVLEAASLLGIRKVVTGSSESAYGFAWAPSPFSPEYFPVDENHPLLPQECYGLSKAVGEQTAAMFARRGGMSVFALRYSMIVAEKEYAGLKTGEPERYYRSLWSYIDIRDAARATLAALVSERTGFYALNITSDDTLSDRPTDRLLSEFYPEAERRVEFRGREAAASNALAKQALDWKPEHSWTEFKDPL
jgi:Nucleoside-diphosphate-sugar epimerases